MDHLQAAELTIVRVIIHVLRQIAPAHLSQMHALENVNRIVHHITTLKMETPLQTAVLIAIVILIAIRQHQHQIVIVHLILLSNVRGHVFHIVLLLKHLLIHTAKSFLVVIIIIASLLFQAINVTAQQLLEVKILINVRQ